MSTIICHDDQTIIAQCTPKGSGAIALMRMSGINAIDIASAISKLASGTKLSEVPTHTVHYGFVVDENTKHLDQVMFIIMRAPRTFTGQDVVEITCHNNPFIIDAIIAQVIKHGARLAQEGEFTKRAYLNNKIDLVQAEAINELIHANTQLALKKSLAQVEGSFSHWINIIEQDVYKAFAYSESSFEFLDEEMEFGNIISDMLTKTLTTIASVKMSFDQQQQIRQGIRIALIGSVNAGKSSLFNALLNKNRAIVSDIAGTTRDMIEAGLYRDGNYWTLIDTAGLRQTNDVIEQEGIKRSFEQAELADIILLMYDSSRIMLESEQKVYGKILQNHAQKCIVIRNKIDMLSQAILDTGDIPVIETSSKNKQHIDHVQAAISQKINELFKGIEAPFLLNQRQFNLLLGLEKKLQGITLMLNGNIQYELVSYHLKDALELISELTGKTVSEKGMDMVFREFCVGK